MGQFAIRFHEFIMSRSLSVLKEIGYKIRLAGPYFTAFLVNRMTIDPQKR